jgi:hypothetical protein
MRSRHTGPGSRPEVPPGFTETFDHGLMAMEGVVRGSTQEVPSEKQGDAVRFWRHREWTGPDPPHDCGGGKGYLPAGSSNPARCCGAGHRAYQCHNRARR